MENVESASKNFKVSALFLINTGRKNFFDAKFHSTSVVGKPENDSKTRGCSVHIGHPRKVISQKNKKDIDVKLYYIKGV